MSDASATGNIVIMIEPGVPVGFGSCCQISSVTNGMNGCNRRHVVSSDVASTPCATRRLRFCAITSLESSYRSGLTSSMYQSQSSSQTKW